jgi:hypothetical protein
MATLTFNSTEYSVDHAVKGPDYVHGYDANGVIIVSFEGVRNFSKIVYSGVYLDPTECLEEACNDVKHCSGRLKRRDGTVLTPESIGMLWGTGEPPSGSDASVYFQFV